MPCLKHGIRHKKEIEVKNVTERTTAVARFEELVVGDRAEFSNFSSATWSGTVVGVGEKDDTVCYQIELDCGLVYWGYEEQFTKGQTSG